MKHLLKIVGYSLGFILVSIVSLAFLVDANMFKPRLASLAQERGIALDMRGNLHWAFWPSVGLAVDDVSIASVEAPGTPIAQVKKASFLIAFIPLMKAEFQVKHILVDNAVIDLVVDEQGKANWASLVKAQDAAPVADVPRKNLDGSVTSNDLHLSIEKISLHNSAITYTDHSKNRRIALTDIQLDVNDMNIEQKPFELQFSWVAQLGTVKNTGAGANADKPLIIKGKLRNQVALNGNFTSAYFTEGKFNGELKSESSAAIDANYTLKLDNIGSNLHYQSTLSLVHAPLKHLLSVLGVSVKTANGNYLAEADFSGDIDGDKQHLAINSIQMKIDKTALTGSLAINDFTHFSSNINLHGDDINVDEYLAPALPEKPAVVNAAPVGNVSPVPAINPAPEDTRLPLDAIKNLDTDITIAFDKMRIKNTNLEKAQLNINAKNSELQQQLNANTYGGSIHQSVNIDTRNQAAQIQFNAVLKDIAVAPLLKDHKLDKSLNLQGNLQANASGQMNGATKNQLLDSLTATINIASDKMHLAPLNVEQQFCKVVNLVNNNDAAQQQWNEYTELQQVSGKATIAKKIITIESLSSNVEKLLLSMKGTINLTGGNYDFLLPLKLNRDASDTASSIKTSAQGCTVSSNYWVERSMSLLRCKGAYAEISPAKDCRPDKELLNALVKDFAEYKFKEKHGEKIDAKKDELMKKLDDKLGGEGKAEQAKALLKNLFKKKNDK